jgi:hypothetical protein
MAITNQQKTNILGVVAGLFNAAPGEQYLTEFSDLIDAGLTESQLADSLAAHSAFTSGIMGGKTTIASQVTVLMNHYGLVVDGIDGSAASQAETFFTNSLESGIGFGEIVIEATNFLLSNTVPTEFADTANLLKNKIKTSEIYSDYISSTDLATLKGPMYGLNGATLLTKAEATSFLVTNKFLFNANTATFDEAISGAIAGPIGFINVPDNFSLNIVSAGKSSVFDIGADISVTLQDPSGLTAGGNAETFTLNATIKTDNTGSDTDGINAQTISVDGVENLAISSNVVTTDGSAPGAIAATHTLAARFIAPDAETIIITGNGGVNLAMGNALDEMSIGKVSEIDASGSTGNVIINFAAHAQSVAYKGSAGTDIYAGSTQGDVITGGKGGDWIILEKAQAARDILILESAADAQISDTNNDGKIAILDELDFEMIDNFSIGSGATDDRIDVTSFSFTGVQRGLVEVNDKVPSFDTDLTSIPDLFSDIAGDRGAAFSEIPLPPEFGVSQTFLFVDANMDGDFTAADDVMIEFMGSGPLSEASLIF